MSRFRQLAPYGAQLISLGGSALLTFGSATVMSAAERGLVAIFMLIATVGGYLIGLGIQSQLLQSSSQADLRTSSALFRSQLWIAAPLSAGLAITVWATHIFPFLTLGVAVCGGVSAYLGMVLNMLGWFEYGQSKYFVATALRGFVPLSAFLALLLLSVWRTPDAQLLAITYTSASAVGVMMMLPRTSTFWRTRPAAVGRIGHYKRAARYFGTQSLVMFLARVPTIAAGIWLGPAAAGVVSVALSLAEVQTSLPQIRSAVTFTEASKSRTPRLHWGFIRPLLLLVPIGMIVVIAGAFIAAPILGEAYSALPIYVIMISPGVAAMAVASSALNVLTVRNTLQAAAAYLALAIGGSILGFAAAPSSEVVGLASWSFASLLCGATLILAASTVAGGPRPHEGATT